jgi:hypothetical protein
LAIYHLSMKPDLAGVGQPRRGGGVSRVSGATGQPSRLCENRGGFERAAVGFELLGVAIYDANVIVRLMTSTPATFRTLWWRSF